MILCCINSIASRGRPRRFPKGDRKALWGVRFSSPVATKRKPNESAETSGLWPRRLRLRTPPAGAKSLPSVKQSIKARIVKLYCKKRIASRGRSRRFPKGDRKALWSRPQARNLCLQQRNRFREYRIESYPNIW